MHFKNGDRLSGELIGVFGGNVLFKSNFSTKLYIAQDLVESLETDRSFDIWTDEGEHSNEPLAREISLANLARIRQPVRAAVALTEGWENRVGSATTYTQGNTSSEAYRIQSDSIHNGRRHELRVQNVIAKEGQQDRTVKDNIETKVNGKWFLADRDWFGSLSFDFTRDPLRDLDARYAASIGLGKEFWHHTESKFAAGIGVSRLLEDFTTTEDRENTAARWEVEYTKKLIGGKVEAFSEHTGLILPDQDGALIVKATQGVKYLLSDSLDLNFRTEISHETDPAPGRKETDLTYITELGLTL